MVGILTGLAVFRFSGILNNPPSLFSDEVDEGYQAFVLNNCGTDYFGNKWPVHFQSFADFRTPLYIYSIAGLERLGVGSELAVRLPSAIMGIVTIGGFFGLIMLVFNNYWLAVTGMVLLAINPWWWHFSRGGWEVVGMIMCLLWALICWLKYLDNKRIGWLLTGATLLAGSFYFYATAKMMAVILGILQIIVWRKQTTKIDKKHLILGLAWLMLVSAPMIKDTLNGRAGYRFNYINIFSDPTNSKVVDGVRYQDGLLMQKKDTVGIVPSAETKIAHNKLSLLVSKFGRNYLKAFSTDYLFLTGDGNLRHGFGSKGYLLYPDFILVILGIGAVIFSKKYKNNLGTFMLGWLLLAPIPNALTRDSDFPNGTRLLLMLIPLMYLVVVGIKTIWNKKWLLAITLVTYGLSFADFYHYYSYHFPQIAPKEWHYGIKEAVNESIKLAQPDDKIYFSNSYEPVLPFFWFYNNYLPSSGSCVPAKALVKTSEFGFEGKSLENKYYFGNFEWREMVKNRSSLENKIFVINSKDMDQIKMLPGVKVDFLALPQIKFTEQEKFWIIRLD